MGTLGAGGTLRLHAATWADLGVWTGVGVPSVVLSLGQWQAQRRGYWAYLSTLGVLVPFQPNDQTTETLSVIETATARYGAQESRPEALGLSEGELDQLVHVSGPMVENRSETIAESESASALLALFAAVAETLGFTDTGSDAYAPVDAFRAFWNALPKPATPGMYPVANGSGSYSYLTASQVLQTIEATTSPGDTQFWISTT